MGWLILLVILALLCVCLWMPLRICITAKARQYTVKCYYGRFSLFTKTNVTDTQAVTSAAVSADEPPDASASEPVEHTSSQPSETAPQAAATPAPAVAVVESLAATVVADATVADATDADATDADATDADATPTAQDEPLTPSPSDETEAADETTADKPARKRHFSLRRTRKPRKRPKKPSLFQWMRPTNLSEGLAFISDALASLSPPLRRLLRHMRLQKLSVHLTIGTEDAAKTAVLYGAVSGAVFRLFGWLQAHLAVQADRVCVEADFLEPSIRYDCSAELRASPGTLLAMAIGMATRFLFRNWRRVRRQDAEQALRDAETTPLPAPTSVSADATAVQAVSSI